MAAFTNKVSRKLFQIENNFLRNILYGSNIVANVNSTRKIGFYKSLSEKPDHDDKYEYEVSKDPNEWKYVERLMPMVTVPKPTPKPVYPSGWRPMKEESLKLPYFVERSKNHMLSVYLINRDRGQCKITKIKRIEGDIWALHDELKEYVETNEGKKIASYVHEGNNVIEFKGDHVYYVEQWMLSKGF